MKTLLLLLLLLISSTASAAHPVRSGSTTTTRRDALHAPMRTSGHLDFSGFACQPTVIGRVNDAGTAWDTTNYATGADYVDTAGTATFEGSPFIPTIGGPARGAMRIDSDADAPYLAASVATAAGLRYDRDFTVITVQSAKNAAGPMSFSHADGSPGSNGFYLRLQAGNILCVLGAAAQRSATSPGIVGVGSRFNITTCKLSGTDWIARINGSEATTAGQTPPTGAPNAAAYFARYSTAGFYSNGAEVLFLYFPCAITAANNTRFEAQFNGPVAEERNITDTRASTACWEAPDGYVYCKGDNSARCDSRGCLSEEFRANYWLYSSDAGSWGQAVASVMTVSTNVASGPLSRYIGAAEVDLLTDDSAVDSEGLVSPTAHAAGATVYTASCYLKAGTTDKVYFRWAVAGAGTSGHGTVCNLTPTALWARYTCSVSTTAIPTNVAAQIRVGVSGSGGETGDFYAAHCQVEPGAFASQPIPTEGAVVARLADAYSLSTHGFPTQQGEIETTFTPEWSSAANYAVSNVLLTVTSGAFSGYGMLWSNTATGALAWIVGKSDFSYTQISSIKAQVAFSSTTYRGRWGNANQWLYTDKALTASNVGTAKIPDSTPATLTFGSNGWHRDVRVAR